MYPWIPPDEMVDQFVKIGTDVEFHCNARDADKIKFYVNGRLIEKGINDCSITKEDIILKLLQTCTRLYQSTQNCKYSMVYALHHSIVIWWNAYISLRKFKNPSAPKQYDWFSLVLSTSPIYLEKCRRFTLISKIGYICGNTQQLRENSGMEHRS